MSLIELNKSRSDFYESYTTQQVKLSQYSRSRFIRETISTLPQESHSGIITLLKDRDEDKFTDIFGTNRVLGGYLAPWVAETVGSFDNDLIKDTAYATFLGRFWFILFDYGLDEPEIVKELKIGSAVEPLFKQAKLAYMSVVGASERMEFGNHFERLHEKSLHANQWEMERRGKVHFPYSDYELQLVGDKIAVVNWTSHAMAIASGKPEVGGRLEEIMNNLFVAVQLNHDLTDAKQDLAMGNCTFPVSIALEELGITSGNMLKNPEEVLEVLYTQPCVGKVIGVINRFATRSIKAGEQPIKSPFIEHLQEMVNRNNQLLLKMDEFSKDGLGKVVIQELKKNQGHPERHAIVLD